MPDTHHTTLTDIAREAQDAIGFIEATELGCATLQLATAVVALAAVVDQLRSEVSSLRRRIAQVERP